MRSQRRLVSPLSAVDLQPNTFIGDVATEIPTKAALATKLAITENDISYFSTVGSDIEARIDINYIIPHSCWKANTNITYFKESILGRCINTGTQGFYGATNLLEVEFLANCRIDQSSFMNSGLKKGIFHNADTMYYFQAFRGTSTDLLFLPKLKFRFGDGTFPTTKSFGVAKNIYMPLVEQIGNTQGDESHFLDCPQSVNIWANPTLETSNGGAEEGDLAYARANKAAIINYAQPVLTPNDFGV